MSEITLLNQFLKDVEGVPLSEFKEFFQKIEDLKNLIKQIESKQKEVEKQGKKIDDKIEGVSEYVEEVEKSIKEHVDNFNKEKKQTIVEIKDWSNKYYKKEVDDFKNMLLEVKQIVQKIENKFKKTNESIVALEEVVEENKKEAKRNNDNLSKKINNEMENLYNKLKQIKIIAILGLIFSSAIIVFLIIAIIYS